MARLTFDDLFPPFEIAYDSEDQEYYRELNKYQVERDRLREEMHREQMYQEMHNTLGISRSDFERIRNKFTKAATSRRLKR